jgi:hypothetical protein
MDCRERAQEELEELLWGRFSHDERRLVMGILATRYDEALSLLAEEGEKSVLEFIYALWEEVLR